MPQPDVGALLRAAAPDRLPETLRGYLQQVCGAGQVEILLADYQLTTLLPLLGGDAGPDAELAARCFSSQDAVWSRRPGAAVLHVPVTAWGERIGVLVVEPNTADPAVLRELASTFATALLAAESRTDRYRRARRRARLTMAAELQWDLLPGRSLADGRFQLAGQIEPAYAVGGDHFDWALDGDRLTVTVLNGFGDGMDAALLTAVAVNAMRNARRSGANIVEQAELASEAVYARYGGTRHVATLLLEVDLNTGALDAVDAGSPRALIARDGVIRVVDLEQQLPIGMFGDVRYEPQRLALQRGDRLLIVSDGVHAAAPKGRAAYGESALAAAIRRTRLQPAADAIGTVMRSLADYHEGAEAEDDAVIVCLDWAGATLAARM
jgi:serine phosphatase RsbU (regulator of sigma subunit)